MMGNKTCIVTGASRGMGRGIALVLAKEEAMGTLQSSDWRGFGFPAKDYCTKNDPVDQIQNQ